MKSGTSVSGESRQNTKMQIAGRERREHRRHDLETQGIGMERWDGQHRAGQLLGKIVDISAGGVRVRAKKTDLRPDQHIRVRLSLPSYAGISPFITPGEAGLEPNGEWIGWMTVRRVASVSEQEMEISGCLVDMNDINRGMLGLYLSTQPLAA